jgi:hypothetical protein
LNQSLNKDINCQHEKSSKQEPDFLVPVCIK